MKHKRPQHRPQQTSLGLRIAGLVGVLIVAGAGSALLIRTRAAVFVASAEAETGLAAGTATTADSVAGASGGGTVRFGQPAGTGFPADQSAPPDLSMIPSTAKRTATLDYNTGDWSQWGDTYGHCPPTTTFAIDADVLRTPDSVGSARYMVSGVCDPIIGSGGVSRRSEHSSREQDEYVYEGDERWYYMAIKPAAGMPTPKYNYFLVTQWHPEGDGSPVFSINFHSSGTVDIGEDHKLVIGPLRKGVWTDYVLHVKHSRSPASGWLEAWENGVKTIQRTPFATMTDGSLWLKQGIYTSPKEGTARHELWHDGLTVWKP